VDSSTAPFISAAPLSARNISPTGIAFRLRRLKVGNHAKRATRQKFGSTIDPSVSSRGNDVTLPTGPRDIILV
jgi:hypothetical protein